MSDDDDDNNLRVVEIKIPPSAVQMGAAEMRKNMDDMIEGHKMLAKLLRHKYLSLIDEGFTKEQALELCRRLEY